MREVIDKLIRDALASLETAEGLGGIAQLDPGLERTRDPRHGDFASNVALRAGKQTGKPPRELAGLLVERIADAPELEAVEIAGPGFINFRVAPGTYHAELRRIVSLGAAYGSAPASSRGRVLIEFVSANPTGPLHVGHGRHAAYGATLSNVLRAAGFAVDEEYYVNDAGRQMDILAASVWLRYAYRLGIAIPFPDNGYQGAYVGEIAANLAAHHGEGLLGAPARIGTALDGFDGDPEERLDLLIESIRDGIGADRFMTVLNAALDNVLTDIKDDLREFSAAPERWYSERGLTESGAVDAVLEDLREREVLYDRDGATWFRTTDYGDDKDRVVVRENGARTYFASDIAYHLDKASRGYDLLLNVLGADHHGYVARVRAGLAAMGKRPECLEVQLVQFVVLYRGQEKAQMSTRSGEYVTLRELRNEVGNDAARFFYVSRSNDQHLEFDLELAKSQTKDNPVYYVQYAHARAQSVLKRLDEAGSPRPVTEEVDLDVLDAEAEKNLMRSLSRFPEIVGLAADNRAPQNIVHYLRELAAEFHAYYDTHKVLVDDRTIRDARVVLLLAVRQVIRNALGLLDVSAPDSM